jgi:hypothetical protein
MVAKEAYNSQGPFKPKKLGGKTGMGQVPTENGCNDGAINSGGVAEQECLRAVARKRTGARGAQQRAAVC